MKWREINEFYVFNHEDYKYIHKHHHAGLTVLWEILDRQKFQTFKHVKIPKWRNPRRKIYKYSNKMYDLYELSNISWINYSTLRNRIHWYWMDIDKAMTQPLKNKLYF